MPTHASFLYARNVANVLALMGPEGTLAPDWDDEIVTGMCVLREGAPMAPAAVELLGRDRRSGDVRRSTVVIAFILQSTPTATAGRRRASSPT